MGGMKSPAPPKAPPVPPPVTVKSPESAQAAEDAKRKTQAGYGFEKTIYRSGGLSAMPAGTTGTLGK